MSFGMMVVMVVVLCVCRGGGGGGVRLGMYLLHCSPDINWLVFFLFP